MKKYALFLLILFAAAGIVFSQTITIDEAIKSGAKEIEAKLAKGVRVVVLNFNSPTDRLSNYVLDEMIAALVNGGKLVVVDRQNLALIQREMNFQMSGEVSDASAQEIGMKLGAQSIISGALEDMGSYYRVRFRTIEVVSAAAQAWPSYSVKKDKQMELLLSGVRKQTATSSTGLPGGLNYTTGRKVGAGVLNMLLGTGSFTMGDWVGGLIVGGVEAVGLVLTISGSDISYKESSKPLEISNPSYQPSQPYSSTNKPYIPNPDRDESKIENGELLTAVGIIVYAAGAVYGYIRPFSYDKDLAKKNGTYIGSSNPMDHINIAIIPDRQGIRAVRLSYNVKF